jgi:hypothetical protein
LIGDFWIRLALSLLSQKSGGRRKIVLNSYKIYLIKTEKNFWIAYDLKNFRISLNLIDNFIQK